MDKLPNLPQVNDLTTIQPTTLYILVKEPTGRSEEDLLVYHLTGKQLMTHILDVYGYMIWEDEDDEDNENERPATIEDISVDELQEDGTYIFVI